MGHLQFLLCLCCWHLKEYSKFDYLLVLLLLMFAGFLNVTLKFVKKKRVVPLKLNSRNKICLLLYSEIVVYCFMTAITITIQINELWVHLHHGWRSEWRFIVMIAVKSKYSCNWYYNITDLVVKNLKKENLCYYN